MEEAVKKPRRIFTPRQKYEMLKEIERYPTLTSICWYTSVVR